MLTDTVRRARRTRCAVALAGVLVAASAAALHAERLPIKTFTTGDGLPHNAVHRIVRDSRGFLWFCTTDGLSRFDGYTFTTFAAEQGLPHSSVNDLLETRTGEYWVATDGGLARFDPKGIPRPATVHRAPGELPSMFTTVAPAGADRGPRAATVLVEAQDGGIWVGTSKGLYRLDRSAGGSTLRPIDIQLAHDFPEQQVILDLLEDREGSLWIASPSGLYRRWPDASAARYTMRDGLPSEFLQDLLQDHDGHLWAATRLGGFFGFSAGRGRGAPTIDVIHNFSFDNKSGLPTSWVSQLFEASDNRFWIATARGLVEFFPHAEPARRFQTYDTANGLSDFNLTSMTEDLGGNLWLGTESSGAMKLTRGGFSTFGTEDGIGTMSALFEDGTNAICFRGTVLGAARVRTLQGATVNPLSVQHASYETRLGCFDGRRFEDFRPAAVVNFGWVSEQVVLRTQRGEWWLGTGEGVYRFPSAARFPKIEMSRPLAVYAAGSGLAASQVFRLFEDSHERIWISSISGTTNGLSRWEPSTMTVHDLAQSSGLPSFADDRPRSFAEDPGGNIWIGFNGGLVRYRGDRFALFTVNEGLPAGAVKAIHVDRSGRVWLASSRAGLVRVDGRDTERPTFVSYTVAEGLSSNNAEVIAEDASGNLYLGGGRGLDRLDPATGRVKHFTTADGLMSGIFKVAFRDRRGVLWFGMSSGLARLAPAADRPPRPPPILITGLRVAGVPHLVSALGERAVSLPQLGFRQNQLQIEFVALGFGPGEVLRYQYRLDGADAEWGAPGEQRTVTYASLAPGRYTFMVRALNSDGVTSDAPATIEFTILSPLWKRAWFLALAAFLSALAIHSVYRFRVARLLEIAHMRTRIATDLHDDIGANLTRIALLSEVAQRSSDGQPLASIARIARESVGSMSDIVWAINPARDSLLDLTRRMRQHADEIFSLRQIALRFDAPGADSSLRLGVDVRRDLLLIFKEAVNNAARHGRCSRAEISLRTEGARLVLGVADNGIGFDTTIESEGQGLASMRRRAHRLKGALEIASVVGGGTRVTLTLPM